MANTWQGTGIFTWQLEKILNGDINAIAQKAKQAGLDYVLIKCANGDLVNDPVSQGFMDEFKLVVSPLKRAGLKVGAWIYQYLTDVPGEVDACVQAIQAGADFLILDAEDGVANKVAQVEQFGQLLRQALPGVPVGVSSYAIADYHPEVPLDKYAVFVDFMAPQIYWADMDWPVATAFSASIKSYTKFNKPIAPTGQAYGSASVQDINVFVSLCKNNNLPGVSWWSMDAASEDQFSALAADKIAAPVPTIAADSSPPAKDVDPNTWYAKAVQYVLQPDPKLSGYHLMSLDENGNFNPDVPVTRAMLAQVLYNMSLRG